MRIRCSLLVVLFLLVLAAPAGASHNNDSCATWAARDSAHPDAPGSYSSFNCSISIDKKYAQVNGRGRYSGTLHHSWIEAIHSGCVLGIWYTCDTRWNTYKHTHG